MRIDPQLDRFPSPLGKEARLDLWRRVWQMFGVHAPAGLFNELEAAYHEPQRHYHGIQHLGECLALLQLSWELASKPHEVGIALWFHDAHYQPAESENELRSASWACRALIAAGVGEQSAQRVFDLVMATNHLHAQQELIQGDAALVLDIDLAILGSPAARYQQYRADVAKEFAFAGPAAYSKGRALVLEAFLARPAIYHTPWAVQNFERQARSNLESDLCETSTPPDC